MKSDKDVEKIKMVNFFETQCIISRITYRRIQCDSCPESEFKPFFGQPPQLSHAGQQLPDRR